MSSELSNFPPRGSTVAVGMSGGVDSTLVSMLLKERGCRVIGATMSSWNGGLPLPPNPNGVRNSCYGPDEVLDIEACRRFCAEQGFEHRVIDVRRPYRENVLEYFKSEYRAGRTPNPCARCNPAVKFGAFLEGLKAAGVEFDYFCTGHYAQLVRPERPPVPGWDIRAVDGSGALRFPLLVKEAADGAKDQTYFLNRIESKVLEKVRFPLGEFTKAKVFELARERKLVAAERGESQDFIPPEYWPLLFADRPPRSGEIVDLDGKVLGVHRGIEHYTVGQRRGLGVSAPVPLYVHSIDAQNNRVMLCPEGELFADGLYADDWVWANGRAPEIAFEAEVKIRLATPKCKATVEPAPEEGEGFYKVKFAAPARAVAPGQSVAVYIDGMILGGGTITRKIPHGRND